MAKYYVTFLVSGTIGVEVEADDEITAEDKAFERACMTLSTRTVENLQVEQNDSIIELS